MSGNEKYTPTRLEWLSTMINSIVPSSTLYDEGIDFVCLPSETDPNILNIRIRHYSDSNKEQIDAYVESIKELIYAYVKGYQWDSWFELAEVIEPVDRNKSNKGNNSLEPH